MSNDTGRSLRCEASGNRSLAANGSRKSTSQSLMAGNDGDI